MCVVVVVASHISRCFRGVPEGSKVVRVEKTEVGPYAAGAVVEVPEVSEAVDVKQTDVDPDAVGVVAAVAEVAVVVEAAQETDLNPVAVGVVEAMPEGSEAVDVERTEIVPDTAGALPAVPEVSTVVEAEEAVDTSPMEASTVADGAGDEWCAVGKKRRATAGAGGGGVETQAEVCSVVDEVRTSLGILSIFGRFCRTSSLSIDLKHAIGFLSVYHRTRACFASPPATNSTDSNGKKRTERRRMSCSSRGGNWGRDWETCERVHVDAETDKVTVDAYATALACAIAFIFPIVFAVTVAIANDFPVVFAVTFIISGCVDVFPALYPS